MKVGIQLFSVKEALAKDPKGTLKQVADLGYKYLEPFANPLPGDESTFGLQMPLEEAKAFLKENGLQVVGAHYYGALFCREQCGAAGGASAGRVDHRHPGVPVHLSVPAGTVRNSLGFGDPLLS